MQWLRVVRVALARTMRCLVPVQKHEYALTPDSVEFFLKFGAAKSKISDVASSPNLLLQVNGTHGHCVYGSCVVRVLEHASFACVCVCVRVCLLAFSDIGYRCVPRLCRLLEQL